jgi:two-component system, NarL family, nitrate/nitrite response regulator NarL
MVSALRVAILEGHRLLRELTARLLRDEGFGVEAAATPEELFSLLDASPFQAALVLMHPQPQSAGLDEGARRLLCELKGFWSQVRVVLVLSGGTEALAAEARALGAADVLQLREASTAALLCAVGAAARGEQQLADGGLGRLREQEAQSRAQSSPRPMLTPREWDVLRHVSCGMDNLKVAAHLGISERTVKSHMTALYRKLGVENRTALALRGRALGLQAVA